MYIITMFISILLNIVQLCKMSETQILMSTPGEDGISIIDCQGAFCVIFTPKIRDCTLTFIINYIMIFETPRQRYPNLCAWNAPWIDWRIKY